MKIKIKLCILMIPIIAGVVGGIAGIQLWKASKISIQLSKRSAAYLARQRAQYWEGRINGYLEVLHTASNVMNYYESIDAEDRRALYEDVMVSIFEDQSDFVRIFTVWKPNALDGMDSRYIGRTGSTETGQFAFALGKESGEIVAQRSAVVSEVMEHITGPNARKDSVSDPTAIKLLGKNAYVVRLIVPIFNKRTNEVVGAVGCQLNIDLIQPTVANDIKEYEEISAMSVYSGNGFVMGNLVPERIGKMLPDVEMAYGSYIKEANQAVIEGTEFQCTSYSSVLKSNLEIILVPFQISNSGKSWTIMIATTESYILKEVNEITRFTIILAAIAIVAASVIVYRILHRITNPIVKVADTLRDISEGEGDLTRSITVKTKDEIGDLALYFNKTLEKIRNLVLNIKTEIVRLANVGNDLSSNMTETAAAINQITANVQSIKGRIINQSASVTQTNASMENVITHIDKLNVHVEDQSNNVSMASSAMEEMVANINEVNQALIKNTNNVKTLLEASEVGHAGLLNVVAGMQEIARESEDLMKINMEEPIR